MGGGRGERELVPLSAQLKFTFEKTEIVFFVDKTEIHF